MSSIETGKKEIVAYLLKHYTTGSTCLDVGACDGKWWDLLGDYYQMDGVEIFKPYIEKYKLEFKYRKVINKNIVGLEYDNYDLIIMGDIIEHLTVQDAQQVIEYAKGKCKELIVAVPFEYPQDEIDGNIYQKHLQPDLNTETFKERYKGFEILFFSINQQYAYYHKGNNDDKTNK